MPPPTITMPTRQIELREFERWTLPLDTDTLGRILAALRDWDPLDWDATFEALASVLDDRAPENHLDDLAERLRGSLMQLVKIALAGLAEQPDQETALLISRARALCFVEPLGSHWKAIGHLRRLGWVMNELLEHLSQAGHLDRIDGDCGL